MMDWSDVATFEFDYAGIEQLSERIADEIRGIKKDEFSDG